MHTSNIDPKQIGYSWVPPGIVTSSKIQKYFDLLPKDKVPKIGSIGERYRIRQLNYQLPKQDIDYACCKHVGLDKEGFEEFTTARNEIALDIGYVKECATNSICVDCKDQINQGELAVNATKFSNRVIWHPRCFQCCVCKELLVDLTYCAYEEKLFCERHYAEIFKPRCNACDEDKIKASINALETVETESVEQMQDGVLYENGYRIDKEQSATLVAQQWDERRKLMCTSDLPSTSETPPKSIISNGCTGNGIQNKRTKNTNTNEYERTFENDENDPNAPNNHRPIERDDRTARRKAFKKRNSSSSQSSDSIRLSREEELKMFTSLEEEEYKNSSSYAPISYSNAKLSNSRKHVDPSVHEKQKYDENPWGNVKPNTFHDSELWKRERATSIEEEREENSSTTTNHKLKMTGATGTADKPTRKTSCENDKYASELDACEQLDHVDTHGTHPLQQNGEDVSMESVAKHDSQTMESNNTINRIDKLPDSSQKTEYALNTEINTQKTASTDPIEMIDKQFKVKAFEGDVNSKKSRDFRSTTVYSRSDSESSNIFHKSISRDSISTYHESNVDLDHLRQRYNRTDSSNSFIQNELDSEEYHHNHRFSMTAETLEYIRGRDDWRVHTENKLNNLYRRQFSNISIREEIDSDEYHHDRLLSDLIEIAYLDSNNIQSLPSSFVDNKVFDRYYLELQQIEGQLSRDIEQQIAQKQVILLDSNEIQATEGFIYPLPDIILDRAENYGDDVYTVEQIDSDYSNAISDSEDDVQSAIEVNHDGEIITTLDVSSDVDEMIEVTLWDLNDDQSNSRSSKESSIEIISFADESLLESDGLGKSGYTTLLSSENQDEKETTSEATQTNDMPDDTLFVVNETSISNNLIDNGVATHNLQENVKLVKVEETQNMELSSKNKQSVSDLTKKNETSTFDVTGNESVNKTGHVSNHQDVPLTNETTRLTSTEKNQIKPDAMLRSDEHKSDRNLNNCSKIEISNSFIEQEKQSSTSSSAKASEPANNLINNIGETSKNSNKSEKKRKRSSYENVDDLVKEGCMGVWFHN